MTAALETMKARDEARRDFRDGAAASLHAVADMSLHDLVDEFVRLSDLIEANTKPSAEEYADDNITKAGELAYRQRNMVVGAARARFGISFDIFDRLGRNSI